MSTPFNTFIYNTLDSEQAKELETAFSFVAGQLKLLSQSKIITSFNIDLKPSDRVIVLLDEMLLAKLSEDANAINFFQDKSINNHQVIIITEDVDLNHLPAYLQQFPVFSFQNTDKSFETEGEFEQESYKWGFVQVSYDILQYFKTINNQSDNLPVVFVGPADGNTQMEHQKIIRELLHRNFKVMPLIQNPLASQLIENSDFLMDLLNQSILAIHFISHESLANYPDKQSAALIVNKMVAEFCQQTTHNKLQRIVYVPDETEETADEVSQKIIQFKSDVQLLKDAEMVQTPVEKFKNIVLLKLYNAVNPPKSKLGTEHPDDIYFIYPPGELCAVEKYFKWLDKEKIKYSHSQIDLDQLDLLDYHQNKLVNCKGVIIYNNGNKEWLWRKLSDIKKAPGWGRKVPYHLKVICGEKPIMEQLDGIIDKSVMVVEEKNNGVEKLAQLVQSKI